MGLLILKAFLGALTQFLGFFVMLAGMLTSLGLGLSVIILNFVLSPNFISLSYTDPARNPFIANGWELTRGLTNIIFVLALIAIGLGTALRITGYQAKKALPLLIIIALLINFTPVILGFIVDATNIVMNYFLQGGFAGGNVISSQFSAAWGLWTSGFTNFFNPAAATNTFLALLTITFFNLMAAAILFLFAFLFIMRYIAIWLLVVLSPLAFACYILPATRGVFNMWWRQFINWSIIGITASFFLYLSDRMIKMVLVDKIVLATAPGDGLGLANTILPWGIVIAFLFLGLMMAMSTSAMGSSLAIRAARGVPKIRPVAQRLGKGAGLGAKGIGSLEKGARRLEQMAGKVPVVGGALKWGVVKPFTTLPAWATRATLGTALERYAAKARRVDIGKDMKDLGIEEDIEGQVEYVNRATTNEQKLQAIAWMANKGTLQKSPQVWRSAAGLVKKFARDPHFGKETGDIADAIPDQLDAETKINLEKTKADREEMKKKTDDTAQKLSTEVEMKPVIDEEAARLLKERIVKTTTEAQDLAARNVAARYIHLTEMKSGDIKNVAKKSIESAVAGRALRDMTPQHLQAVVNNFKTETVHKVLENTFDKMFSGKTDEENRKILDEYYSSDPRHARMVHWASTTPSGREMNLKFRQYMTDPNDQPTTNLDAYERRQRVEKIVKDNPALRNARNLLKNITAVERDLTKARTDAETKAIRQQLESLEDRMSSVKDEFLKERPENQSRWEEMEGLVQPPGRRRKGGQAGPPPTPSPGPRRPPRAPSGGPSGEEKQMTPEELATEVVKGALSEVRREKRQRRRR